MHLSVDDEDKGDENVVMYYLGGYEERRKNKQNLAKSS